jgi:3,4-dihydroxy 2-butanone 4-phosphate synthase/GTP cyclohydrolase II
VRAADGGVLRRAGHPEAAVDLTRMAGLPPVAVVGEVVDHDGNAARGARLRAFAATHHLPVVAMPELIAHRHRTERLVEFKAASRLPTEHGEFTAHGFRSVLDGREHIALVMGDIERGERPPLVRVHSECLTGNVFDSVRCDCSTQLQRAMQLVAAEGRGVVLYLRTQDRHTGALPRLHACHLQRSDAEHLPEGGHAPDPREYGVGARILADLGVRRMRLLTNNPVKRIGLQAYGLEVVRTEPLTVRPTVHNLAYLRAKRDRMGHDLLLPEPDGDVVTEASSCG